MRANQNASANIGCKNAPGPLLPSALNNC